jgi:hypothetical protein
VISVLPHASANGSTPPRRLRARKNSAAAIRYALPTISSSPSTLARAEWGSATVSSASVARAA